MVSGRQYLTLLFITFGTLCGTIYSKTLVCFFKAEYSKTFGMFFGAIYSSETLGIFCRAIQCVPGGMCNTSGECSLC